jgi:hypothetical protein
MRAPEQHCVRALRRSRRLPALQGSGRSLGPGRMQTLGLDRIGCARSRPLGRNAAWVTRWSGAGSVLSRRAEARAPELPSDPSLLTTGDVGRQRGSGSARLGRWRDGARRRPRQPTEQAGRCGSRQDDVRPSATRAKPTTKFVDLERHLAHANQARPGRRVPVDSRLHVNGLDLERVVILAPRGIAGTDVRAPPNARTGAFRRARALHQRFANPGRGFRLSGPARVFAHERGLALEPGAKRRTTRRLLRTRHSSPVRPRDVKSRIWSLGAESEGPVPLTAILSRQ